MASSRSPSEMSYRSVSAARMAAVRCCSSFARARPAPGCRRRRRCRAGRRGGGPTPAAHPPVCTPPADRAGTATGVSGSSSVSTGRSRCAPRSPSRRSRTRRDSECGVSRWTGNGMYPHWSIGGSNGTARVAGSRRRVDRHRCGDPLVTGFAFFNARARSRLPGRVTTRSRTRSHRTTAHDPHSSGSSAGRTSMCRRRSRSARCRRPR